MVSSMVVNYGFKRSYANHLVFVAQSKFGLVIMVIYVDNVIITGNIEQVNMKLKERKYCYTELGQL